MTTASIRDLRTSFPKIRRLIESEGEVVVTERGEPRYVLRSFTPPPGPKKKQQIDYYARLVARMPKMLTEKQSRALDRLNCGDR